MNTGIQKNDEKALSEKIGTILLKYRVVFITFIFGIFILSMGLVGGNYLITKIRKDGLGKLDKLEFSLTDARSKLSETELAQKEDGIISEIEALALKNSKNIVGARSYLYLGDHYFAKKNWEKARTAYEGAAAAKVKSYTNALSFYNSAVCSEELNDLEKAAEFYLKAYESGDFSLKPHALFNLGRVEEKRGNFSKAAEQYDLLSAKFPSDQWANLGKSRSLMLRVEGKAN